jgi:hypothetical protein
MHVVLLKVVREHVLHGWIVINDEHLRRPVPRFTSADIVGCQAGIPLESRYCEHWPSLHML